MNPCKDYKGNSFPSLTAMCKAYDISPPAYKSRIKRGWSIEKSLTTPLAEGAKGYEYYIEQTALYRTKHADEIRENSRIYREKNKNKMKKYQEEYRKRPKSILEKSKTEIIFL